MLKKSTKIVLIVLGIIVLYLIVAAIAKIWPFESKTIKPPSQFTESADNQPTLKAHAYLSAGGKGLNDGTLNAGINPADGNFCIRTGTSPYTYCTSNTWIKPNHKSGAKAYFMLFDGTEISTVWADVNGTYTKFWSQVLPQPAAAVRLSPNGFVAVV